MCIDWLNAHKQMQILENESVEYLHWDVADGSFVPDFTMGSSIINTFRQHTNMCSDYHLMVEEPSRVFDSFNVAPGDIFTIHQEACRNLHRDLVKIRQKGARVGLAICPATPLEVLDYIVDDIDVVLVMMVNPGFKGQKLIPQMLKKIESLYRLRKELDWDFKIEIDGNVSPSFICEMTHAGADILVGGSSGLFRKDVDLPTAIACMREQIQRGLTLREQK